MPGPDRARLGDRVLASPPTSTARELARLCARVENDWVGAQHRPARPARLALSASPTRAVHRLPHAGVRARAAGARRLAPGRARLGRAPRATRARGYNERRAECARACELLGVELAARGRLPRRVARLPEPLRLRARHVLGENERVRAAVAALRAAICAPLAPCSTPRTRACATATRSPRPPSRRPSSGCASAGAAGARVIGGGFGGSVLGLFAPDVRPPAGAREVRPAPGAHLLKLRRVKRRPPSGSSIHSLPSCR